jgi:hypothetical protein
MICSNVDEVSPLNFVMITNLVWMVISSAHLGLSAWMCIRRHYMVMVY